MQEPRTQYTLSSQHHGLGWFPKTWPFSQLPGLPVSPAFCGLLFTLAVVSSPEAAESPQRGPALCREHLGVYVYVGG